MTGLDVPVATLSDATLTLGGLLASLWRTLRLRPIVREVLAVTVVVRAARDAGLAVTADELQQAANRYRLRNGLRSAAATDAWLRDNGLTTAELQLALEEQLLAAKFQDHLLATRGEGHFADHAPRYQRVRLRVLAVPSEEAAREMLAQLADGADFAALAREHSRHASRDQGGDLGVVHRGRLETALADLVFAAEAGRVVGPVAQPAGSCLFLVEEVLPAERDAATDALIRADLYAAWLSEQLKDRRLDLVGIELATRPPATDGGRPPAREEANP